jgi:hypothetical protein
METIPGISLYSYLHLKLAKMPCFSYYILCFSFNKIRSKKAEQVLPGGGAGGRWPKYIHI